MAYGLNTLELSNQGVSKSLVLGVFRAYGVKGLCVMCHLLGVSRFMGKGLRVLGFRA